jgi:hypothetical protein
MGGPTNPNNNITLPAAIDPLGINRNTIPGHKPKQIANDPNKSIINYLLNTSISNNDKKSYAKIIQKTPIYKDILEYLTKLDNLTQQKIRSFLKGGSRKRRNKTRKQ